MFRSIIFIITLSFSALVFAQSDNVVNVYNWSKYIPRDVLKKFQKETGIHVNYTTYESNEELYAKLKADPNIGYDVVVPSANFVERMINEDMLQPLDHQQLPNIKYMNPLLMNKPYDRGNRFSVPYLISSTNIMVNKLYFDPNKISTWSDIWNPRYKDKLLLVDDVRDVFSAALISLGYSINTEDPKKIRKAYLRLKALLPNIKLFNNGATIPIYADEDAVVGMILNGDAIQAMKENKNLRYIYPKDGVILAVDNLVIPKNAPHIKNAYRFINFIMRPDIAKEIVEQLGYTSPNKKAVELLPKKLRNNPIINPPKKVLKRAQIESYVSLKTTQLYLHYWQLLKLGA